MWLSKVIVTDDVLTTISIHAHTTEREEIMGVLIGDILDTDDGKVARVWSVSVLQRSDKRKDRVEISPEQLSQSAEEAEKLGKQISRETRVVGWYHSHPRITVLPSHVDVRTQHDWQAMDSSFFGIILSCFERTTSRSGRTQLIAFQSIDSQANSEMSKMSADQKQLILSAGSRFVRHELPIQIVQIHDMLTDKKQAQVAMKHSLSNLVKLQNTILQEEKDAFMQATYEGDAANDIKVATTAGAGRKASELKMSDREERHVKHPLTALHNFAVYQKTLYKLLEHGCLPLIQEFHHKAAQLQSQVSDTKKQNEELRKQIEALKNVS